MPWTQRIFFTFFLTVAGIQADSQSKAYAHHIKIGDSLSRSGQFLQAALQYNDAFATFGGKGFLPDRYNAARNWALAGVQDSALLNLEKIVYRGRYASHYRMSADTAFNTLHDKARWLALMDTARAISAANDNKRREMRKYYDTLLAGQLEKIYYTDQVFRKRLRETETSFGRDSKEVKDLWDSIRFHDSVNLEVVIRILDTRGWPGPEVVGGGSETIFLVIQHSDLKTQLKYLPLARKAAQEKKIAASSLALLEDRVLMGQGKKQIYGSQIKRDPVTGKYYLAPLEDPDNVDRRRAQMGLGPIADYVSHWDIKWDPETFKNEQAEREYQKR